MWAKTIIEGIETKQVFIAVKIKSDKDWLPKTVISAIIENEMDSKMKLATNMDAVQVYKDCIALPFNDSDAVVLAIPYRKNHKPTKGDFK